jgi:tetratricopeptide (TPR) repeat protein
MAKTVSWVTVAKMLYLLVVYYCITSLYGNSRSGFVISLPGGGNSWGIGQNPMKHLYLLILFVFGSIVAISSGRFVLTHYYHSRGLQHFDLSQYEEAQSLLEKANWWAGRSDGQILIELGKTALMRGEEEQAEERFRAALRLAVDDASTHMRIGDTWSALGRWGKAVAAYQRGAELDREHARLRDRLLRAYAKTGRLHLLGKLIDATEFVSPDGLDGVDEHVIVGQLLADRGRWKEAGAFFERAVGLDPAHAEALHKLGIFHRRRGDEVRAAALLRRSVAARPTLLPAWAVLAELYLQDGKEEEALAACEQVLDQDPHHSHALHIASSIWDARGLHERAREFRARAWTRIPASEWQGQGAYLARKGESWADIFIIAGRASIRIEAKGVSTGDTAPHMEVLLDGRVVGEAAVTDAWQAYIYELVVENAGTYRLGVHFTNDLGPDRDLMIRNAEVRYLPVE